MKKAEVDQRRTNVTYRQIDRLLLSIGFKCQEINDEVPVRVYYHPEFDAEIVLPRFPKRDRVLDYHLYYVKTTLDDFGIVDARSFTDVLQRAG